MTVPQLATSSSPRAVRPWHGREAVALLMTVMIATLLIVLVVSFVAAISTENTIVSTQQARAANRHALNAGWAYAEAYLLMDRSPDFDTKNEDWSRAKDTAVNAGPETSLTVEIEDEESKINLLTLLPEQVRPLWKAIIAGVIREALGDSPHTDDTKVDPEVMVDNLIAWITADGGEEEGDLIDFGEGEVDPEASVPKVNTQPMALLSELELIEGYTRGFLYGRGAEAYTTTVESATPEGEETPSATPTPTPTPVEGDRPQTAFVRYVSIFSTQVVNLNTAPIEVLRPIALAIQQPEDPGNWPDLVDAMLAFLISEREREVDESEDLSGVGGGGGGASPSPSPSASVSPGASPSGTPADNSTQLKLDPGFRSLADARSRIGEQDPAWGPVFDRLSSFLSVRSTTFRVTITATTGKVKSIARATARREGGKVIWIMLDPDPPR